jgi:modulator of FtsH protease HflC
LVSDNQRLEVDAFVRYHIADPLLFYQSVFDTRGADAQLGGMLNSALRRSLSGASITDIVRDKRGCLDGRHPRPDDHGRQTVRS